MKNLITLMLFLVVSISAFSQIEVKKTTPDIIVGKVQSMGYITAELSYKVIEADTIYTVVYHNCRYQSIVDFKSFSFDGVNNTKGEFCKILKSFFIEENKKNKDYKLDIKLGDTYIKLEGTKMGFGTYCVRIWTERGYFYLVENQIDKLFGMVQ